MKSDSDDYLLYTCAIVAIALSAGASFLTKNRILLNVTLVLLALWLLVALFVSMTIKIVILLIIAAGLIITSALVATLRYDLTTGRKKRSKPSWASLLK